MKLWNSYPTFPHNDHHDCNPLFKTVKHDFEATWPLRLVVTSPPSQIWQLCWQGSDALYLLGPGLFIIIIIITTVKPAILRDYYLKVESHIFMVPVPLSAPPHKWLRLKMPSGGQLPEKELPGALQVNSDEADVIPKSVRVAARGLGRLW